MFSLKLSAAYNEKFCFTKESCEKELLRQVAVELRDCCHTRYYFAPSGVEISFDLRRSTAVLVIHTKDSGEYVGGVSVQLWGENHLEDSMAIITSIVKAWYKDRVWISAYDRY